MGCIPGSLSCTCVNTWCSLGTGAGCLGPGLVPNPGASWIIAHNPFVLETLRSSRPNRHNGWDLHYELLPECLQFLSGQGTEERFQHDRCLPHACIQVVSEHFEFPPATVRVHRRPVGNILYDSASFFLQFFDNVSKCMQFVKETRPASENYFRQQIVHE